MVAARVDADPFQVRLRQLLLPRLPHVNHFQASATRARASMTDIVG